ncbi:ABC transporter ATP-binding protein [Streptomyces sp. NPDC002577]
MTTYVKLWAELLRLSWRRVPGLTAAVFGLHLVSVVSIASVSLLLSRCVDAALREQAGAAAAAGAGAATVYAVMAVTEDMRTNVTAVALEKVALLELQPRIYRDVATLEGLDHLERTDVLDRITVLRGSAWGLMQSTWSAVGTVFTALQLSVLLFLLGSVSPWLLFLLVFAAVPVWSDHRGQAAVRDAETATAESYRLQEKLFDLATEPGGGKEIRVAGAGRELVARQSAAWREAMAERTRARVTAAVWKLVGWVVFTTGFTAGLALVVHRAAAGHGGAGDIVLAVTVATSLRQSVHAVVAQTTSSSRGGRLIEPFLWLRAYVAAERAKQAGTLPAPTVLKEGIEFEDVTYTYPGTGRPALEGISVTLPAGSVVAVVGEYGSGKTTLAKLLCRFYRPDRGAVRVDGTDLGELDTAAWRSRISAAFQDFGRFETVLAENIGLGDLPHLDDRDRIAEAVRAADGDRFVARLPQGLDTQLGRRFDGVDLSEGQWQKTALGRASMRRTPLLFLLDEPTASLDAPSEQEIFQRYMTWARELAGRTGAITLIVSHRFSTVNGADLILVLDKGRIVESGTHDELVAVGGRYAELYGIQATAYASADS